MDSSGVKAWLKKQARAELAGNTSMAIVFACAALVVLTATAWGLWLASESFLPTLLISWGKEAPTNLTHALAVASVLGLMFVAEYLSQRDRQANPWREFQQMAAAEFDYFPAIGRLLMGVVLIGPRLVTSAIRFQHAASQWRAVDLEVCTRVLDILRSRPRRVPLEELIRTVSGFDAVKTVAQLRLIAGVVFLPSPPAGISLTNELRAELGGRIHEEQTWRASDRFVVSCPNCQQQIRVRIFLVGSTVRCPSCQRNYRTSFDLHGGIRLEPEPTREQRRMRVTADDKVRTPYVILGISTKATVAEVKRAYRKLMKLNHPDVVGGSDAKARERAEEKTKEINRAYHELLERLEGDG